MVLRFRESTAFLAVSLVATGAELAESRNLDGNLPAVRRFGRLPDVSGLSEAKMGVLIVCYGFTAQSG